MASRDLEPGGRELIALFLLCVRGSTPSLISDLVSGQRQSLGSQARFVVPVLL